MVGVRAAAALVALALLACGVAPEPERVVALYFETLGRDPLRAGSLVSGELQAAHGLRHVGSTRAVEGRGRADSELVWLATQAKPVFAERAAKLSVSPLSVREAGGVAEVSVQVSSPGAPPFVQRFHLSRDVEGRWRIDRIDQDGVDGGNLADAFVAAPTEALRQRLAAALGVPAQ